MAVFGQKQTKWGQQKKLWHPNLKCFFDEVIIFEFVGYAQPPDKPKSVRSQKPAMGAGYKPNKSTTS